MKLCERKKFNLCEKKISSCNLDHLDFGILTNFSNLANFGNLVLASYFANLYNLPNLAN